MKPTVRGALRGWTEKLLVKIITKTVIDHQSSETFLEKRLSICVQPLPEERVQRKPEEQRTWKWSTIWVVGKTIFKPDDTIIVKGKRYRVDSVNDWVDSGYSEYEVIEDYGS